MLQATDGYREGLADATDLDLANERKRLQGALCGDDLDKALPEVRELLESQLRAVEAEQRQRTAAGAGR